MWYKRYNKRLYFEAKMLKQAPLAHVCIVGFLFSCKAAEKENADSNYPRQFEEGILPDSMQGGYIDSTFINKAGDRIDGRYDK
jgi:hypothetical protein